jgi:hypothetical protein
MQNFGIKGFLGSFIGIVFKTIDHMRVNLLLVFLVLPFLSLAQKYHPFPFKTIQYSYAEGDSLYILKKDPLSSSREIYFNPIVKFDLETKFLHGTIDSNNIFGQKLLTISDTAYIFVSAPKDSFFIYPYAKLNTPFEFTKTIGAQITSREKELVLGVMDSVITIELTTGEMIKLSESYGFVQTTRLDQLGQISAINFRLSAIPEANLGKYFYDPANIFDFEVGDVFGFEGSGTVSIFTDKGLTRKEVIKKEVYADSIVYTFKENIRYRRGYYQDEVFYEREYREVISTLINEDIATYALCEGDNPFYEIPGAIGRNKLGRFSGAFRGQYHFEDFAVEGVIDYDTFKRYTLGFGLVDEYYGGYSDGGTELVCYTKQDESYGNCDSLYTVILSNKPSKISESISLFPNPAKDKITISNLDKGQCSIWSITGQRISEQNINSSGELDISRLSSGIYMLIVDRPEGNLHLRFEKL